ncbi:hypothetical protein TrVFT333_007902, partial [Trichoderma virens FT-333]
MGSISLENPNLYTVGWICALPIERAASIEMLNIRHNRPRNFTQPQTDNNSYAWGSIGAHNVVIASLPEGRYGLVSAANAATTMLSTFPGVRFGLMVGIGAGIPRLDGQRLVRDIRLGDVVISRPEGRSGGVVQYDFAKVLQGGAFERIGSLNSPPEVLLNAVTAIRAQHESQRSHIPELLRQMTDRNGHLRDAGYTYQEAENDRLFPEDVTHAGTNDCSACDTTQQVPRPARTPDPTHPRIHYGVIASGNTLIKDPTRRAELVRQTGEDCICFEMEAAGLMNHFPCLVIRGISDYADSHKNDRWQRYAAAVAAAYAKELLEHVSSQTPTALNDLNQASPAATNEIIHRRFGIQFHGNEAAQFVLDLTPNLDSIRRVSGVTVMLPFPITAKEIPF